MLYVLQINDMKKPETTPKYFEIGIKIEEPTCSYVLTKYVNLVSSVFCQTCLLFVLLQN